MAHLIQRLTLAVVLAAAAMAQNKPFSHQQHLAMKLVCTTCHQTISQSTKAEDNNLPAAEVCKSCHTDGRAAGVPVPRKVDRFNHQLHTKMGNLAPMIRAAITANKYLDTKSPANLDTINNCAGCHHGIEQSQDVKAASVYPHMADCLLCHNKIDPPFSCEKCHNNVPALKPASHAANFLDEHNRKKATLDRTGCANCHGKTFTCLGCH